MEQKYFGKPNRGPKLVIVDYSKSIIKAVLDVFDSRSFNTWTKCTNRIVYGGSKKYGFSGWFIHVCTYHLLHMGRRKINQILNFTVQQILGRLICYIDLKEARPFVKDICIFLTTERRSDLVEYHVHLKAI